MKAALLRPCAALVLSILLAACAKPIEASSNDTAQKSQEGERAVILPAVRSEQSNIRVMQRFIRDFLPTGDAALAEQLLAPDVTIHFGGSNQVGRDAYLKLVAANRSAFPDLIWSVDQMVADGDSVAVRYTMTGTHDGEFAGIPATGRRVRAQSMAFYRISGGKIVEERAQLDLTSVFQQLGAVDRN